MFNDGKFRLFQPSHIVCAQLHIYASCICASIVCTCVPDAYIDGAHCSLLVVCVCVLWVCDCIILNPSSIENDPFFRGFRNLTIIIINHMNPFFSHSSVSSVL